MSLHQTITVTVVFAATRDQIWQEDLDIPAGFSVAQAIGVSGFEGRFPEIDWKKTGVGSFGRRLRPEQRLSNGDRIEIYRELVFDPKESRRRRALHRQRQKQSGEQENG